MVTIREVAKRARVSTGTVSNVLSGSESVKGHLRARVLAAMRDLDYQPNQIARSLKTRQTKMLGMVVTDITNPFFPLMIRGAEDAAMKANYLLITINTDDHIDRERQVVSLLRARKVDGILLVIAPSSGDVAHIQKTIEMGVPIVCLDRIPQGISVDTILVNNIKGSEMCVRHLISMGHRRIGFIAGNLGTRTGVDRLRGYKHALEQANLPVCEDLIKLGDFRHDSGYLLTKQLCLSPKPPSAIFASNEMMGVGALKAIFELGLRCPEDIALAVFDDMPFGEVIRPQLTGVAQPAYEIGYRGTERIIDRIEGRSEGEPPQIWELEPELKVRQSTQYHFRGETKAANSPTYG
jgi:LacI family transcriptional regulator